jgi:hypothetical protein
MIREAIDAAARGKDPIGVFRTEEQPITFDSSRDAVEALA